LDMDGESCCSDHREMLENATVNNSAN
jgi:hypothetical protein